MPDMADRDRRYTDTPGEVPTTAEALARLDMPLVDAMMTQRAVRRVYPDPIDDEILMKCIDVALHAPTGANGQNWEFIVIKDYDTKKKLAKRYGFADGIARLNAVHFFR